MKKKAIIIGGGVSGITTALTLQLAGFETAVFAEKLVSEDSAPDPKFASLYPAASVIPHSVESGHLHTLFPASLDIFRFLLQQQDIPVELQRHFELYEFSVDFPDYTRYLLRCDDIRNSSEELMPARPGGPPLHGWVFDCYVARWPLYMNKLYDLYRQTGGVIKQQKVTPEGLAKLPSEIVINCTGMWSEELFGSDITTNLIRGHLVHVPGQVPLKAGNGRVLSYNYTPLPSVYSTPGGQPSDVYFYPVGDKWILGGSRQSGSLTKEESWQGEQHEDTVTISGVEVPQEIIRLNQEILTDTFKRETDIPLSKSYARIGYRFTSGEAGESIRLGTEERFGKMIFHNYGHGGAGVTLSWGCALKVLQLVSDAVHMNTERTPSTAGPHHKLQLQLQKAYSEHFSSN